MKKIQSSILPKNCSIKREPITMEQVDELLKQGLSIFAVAKRLGIAQSSLRLRLRVGRRYLTCLECGKQVPIKIGECRVLFCSDKCRNRFYNMKYHRRDHPKKEFDCAFCGVHVKPDWGDMRKRFCCDKCREQYKYKNKKGNVKREFDCKFCGVHVKTEYGDKRRTFCSKECSQRYAYTRLDRYNATRRKKETINSDDFTPTTFYCKMCGETAVTTPDNPTPFFCCDLCREWYSKYLTAKNKRLIYERFEKAKKENCDNDKRDND